MKRALELALCTWLILPQPGRALQVEQGPAQTVALADVPSPYADPERAAPLLDELRRLQPESIPLHLGAAREHAALGILRASQDERRVHLREAQAAARAALALDSTAAEAHYWLAASLGLLADEEGGRTKISLAREAYREVLVTLELDPRHGGAHHLLGRLHSGARRLGWANRLIARGLGLGEILREASWESAEEHLRTAVKEDPDPWVHTVELARLLLRRDGKEEGRALLEELMRRTAQNPLDRHYRGVAAKILVEGPG